MKKVTKTIFLLAALVGLAACEKPPVDPVDPVDPVVVDPLQFAEGTELRVAAGYQKTNEAISFQDASITGEGIELANGKTYHTGELKPTWESLQNSLKMKFTDKFTGAGSAQNEFKVWENQLDQVDIVAGNADALVAAGSEGKLIDFNQYLDKMPNFKSYLQTNQIARLSITGNTETGAIYFSPYFDGVDDIERMPLVRADFVRALLDEDISLLKGDRALKAYAYQPYMPTSGSVTIKVCDSTGKVSNLTKDYSKYGNIVAKMNEKTGLKGKEAVQMFRDYIDKTYGGHYAKRSDLFCGYDAAFDADEMVALLRCAVACLNDVDGNAIAGLYSRESSNLQRNVDLYRFAGSLFGVRGLEARKSWTYFDSEGKLHDARQEAATYDAVLRMNQLTQEGLINVGNSATSTNMLEKEAGIMSYDYNQTQTLLNSKSKNSKCEYVAIMVPVAKWNDGKKEEYKRFTESWRSVKTDGWAISKAGVGSDENKLHAALKLFDFAFSVQGQITMSYGPDEFIKVKDKTVEVSTWADVAKKYETFNFNGVQMPVMSEANYASLQKLAGGNYTNFARRYLGSTLNGFPKSQAFEYQCTTEIGKKGSAVLATAIGAGIIEHPLLKVNTENMWYTSTPTTLPSTSAETAALKEFTSLSSNFSESKGGTSFLFNIIEKGTTYEGCATKDASGLANYVKTNWQCNDYLEILQNQWNKLLVFYNSIK